MAKFKVGDHVRGNSLAKRYGITREGWEGIVDSVHGALFKANSLPGNESFNSNCGQLNEDAFDLVPKRFKKGDLVTGTPDNPYGVLTKDFVGEVMDDQRGDFLSVICIKPATEDIDIKGAIGFQQSLSARYFMSYYGDDPRKKAPVPKKASTKQPQAFMEGVDVRIDECDNYYDITTDEYIDEIGNIIRYLKFIEVDRCWLMELRMADGEILEVLEGECVGFGAITSPKKAATPKRTTVTTQAHTHEVKDPGHSSSLGNPFASSYPVKAGKTSTMVGNPCAEVTKGFDITNPVEKTHQVDFKAPSFQLDSSKHKEKVAKVAF